ncbi:Uncharacterized protein CLAVI_000653 [Candidatus Clavichlamydia salmonicola]|uniref:single-stranded-DNA-specific exonuclease RecJ n=1 Tax=Candidatus Clavichlamydia salmonicola TaxID=469812 RepID=UPI001890D48C|nr:single-stranded-DNA-specific exonuclease RecJ [Candidatus Clavichlamydia salmonicola]MBF5051026.1 Uncharacterized protein [Candidatus Clavichlamydia salmonicola]
MIFPQNPVEWVYPTINLLGVEKIVKEFSIHPVTAACVFSRGSVSIKEVNRFLYAKLPDLYDPRFLPGMTASVLRIVAAMEKGEKILVYGDTDVDGMTGTALLVEFFRDIGIAVDYLLPSLEGSRHDYFYQLADEAKIRSCSLIITVDCGTSAGKALTKVVKDGIDVIITDHHELTDKLSECTAVLNPKRAPLSHPSRDLTGVGVAFKLVHAITHYLVGMGISSDRLPDLKKFLDLVALGTVADMGVLKDENRILVTYGIKQLRMTSRVGLRQLMEDVGVKQEEAKASDISLKIAPRLNSLGRVGKPMKGIDLLLTEDLSQAKFLSEQINDMNRRRQMLEQHALHDVEVKLAKEQDVLKSKAIFLFSDKWQSGIVPLLATRLSKNYNRPAVVVAIEGNVSKGSARTVRNFALLPILSKCKDFLINYGGHPYAAGFTLKEDNLIPFKKRFLHIINSSLRPQDIVAKMFLDAQVDFEALNDDLMASLDLLEPFGNENPPPVFYCDVNQVRMPKIIGGAHLKVYLKQNSCVLEGMAFGMIDKLAFLKKTIHQTLRIAYTPQVYGAYGKYSIRLILKDFQLLDE